MRVGRHLPPGHARATSSRSSPALRLAASAFLPWVIVGDVVAAGHARRLPALWVAGLGALAAVLALLSLITRKNSRHPLLVVGLVALGIMFLSWRIMPRTAGERALTRVAGVRDRREHAASAPRRPPLAGSGIYLGLAASAVHRRLRPDDRRQARGAAVRRSTSPDDDVVASATPHADPRSSPRPSMRGRSRRRASLASRSSDARSRRLDALRATRPRRRRADDRRRHGGDRRLVLARAGAERATTWR